MPGGRINVWQGQTRGARDERTSVPLVTRNRVNVHNSYFAFYVFLASSRRSLTYYQGVSPTLGARGRTPHRGG